MKTGRAGAAHWFTGGVTRACILMGLILTSSCAQQDSPPSLILHNGQIVTLSELGTVEAIAIREGRILAVGTNDVVTALAGADTRRVDLEGNMALPGFTDNHFHSVGGGAGVDLSKARTIPELITAIRERAEVTPEGEVIRTNSDWHEGQLEEQRLAYRDELDEATNRHPVIVARGGHEYILNSRALERWSINESTPAPSGGTIGRYADGRLNGELVDHAKDLVRLETDLPTTKSLEERLDELEKQHRVLNRAGLTSVRYAGGSLERFEELRELKRRDRLTIRANFLLRLPNQTPLEDIEDLVGPWQDASIANENDSWLRIAGIKLGVDGGFEGGWMSEPYLEPMGKGGTYFGLQTFERDLFIDTARLLHEKGFRLATHAVGDQAIDLVLDAYEAANEDAPIGDRRFSIEHGFVARPEQLPRMKALGLHLSAQHHLYVAAPSLATYWGDDRASKVTPVKTYLEAGIPVSLGTDAPVIPYPPLGVLHHFITRDTLSAGTFGPEERLERLDALKTMSLGYAALTFSEEDQGSLEPGKLADLVVLDRDLLTCPEKDIPAIEIVLTIVDGTIVYQ